MPTIQPDAPTIDRIKNLAIVGTAIKQAYSEENQAVFKDLFPAKAALSKFEEGIRALKLDPEDLQGMLDLIEYLDKKIDRRMNGGVDRPF